MPFFAVFMSVWGRKPHRKWVPKWLSNWRSNSILKTKRTQFWPLRHPHFDPLKADISTHHLKAVQKTLNTSKNTSLQRILTGAYRVVLPTILPMQHNATRNAVNAWISHLSPHSDSLYHQPQQKQSHNRSGHTASENQPCSHTTEAATQPAKTSHAAARN